MLRVGLDGVEPHLLEMRPDPGLERLLLGALGDAERALAVNGKADRQHQCDRSFEPDGRRTGRSCRTGPS